MTIGKGRTEAFSDGVIAILITIMVLDFKVPQTADAAGLIKLGPTLMSYAISYVMIGIYWTNHHHLLHAAQKVSGSVLWANLHLLFWLSFFPFLTGWLAETHFAPLPVALYGVVLFLAGFAYYVLTRRLLAVHSKNSTLTRAVGNVVKERVSLVIYATGIALSFKRPWIGYALYVSVAVLWLVPDRRIENANERPTT